MLKKGTDNKEISAVSFKPYLLLFVFFNFFSSRIIVRESEISPEHFRACHILHILPILLELSFPSISFIPFHYYPLLFMSFLSITFHIFCVVLPSCCPCRFLVFHASLVIHTLHYRILLSLPSYCPCLSCSSCYLCHIHVVHAAFTPFLVILPFVIQLRIIAYAAA